MPNKPVNVSDAVWRWSASFAENTRLTCAEVRERVRAAPPPNHDRSEVYAALVARIPGIGHDSLRNATMGLVTVAPPDAVNWAKALPLPDGRFPAGESQMLELFTNHPPPADLSKDQLLSGILHDVGNSVDIPISSFRKAIAAVRSRAPSRPASPSGRPEGVDQAIWAWSEPLGRPPFETPAEIRDYIKQTPPPSNQGSQIRGAIRARVPLISESSIYKALVGLQRPLGHEVTEWAQAILQSERVRRTQKSVARLLRRFPPPTGARKADVHAALTQLREFDLSASTVQRAYDEVFGRSAVARPQWLGPLPPAGMQGVIESGTPPAPPIAPPGRTAPGMRMVRTATAPSPSPTFAPGGGPSGAGAPLPSPHPFASGSGCSPPPHSPFPWELPLETLITNTQNAEIFLGQSEEDLLDSMIPDIGDTLQPACTGSARNASNSAPQTTEPSASREYNDDQGWER